MNKIGKLVSHPSISVHLIETVILALVLFSTSLTQIKIKERIEIKPSDTLQMKPMAKVNCTPPQDTILDQISNSDLSLGVGGGFIESCDNIYDDCIFIPRIGGTIGIAYHIWYSQNPAYLAWDFTSDALYVIGKDGKAKNRFLFDNFWDCTTLPDGSVDCHWNRYALCQDCYNWTQDSAQCQYPQMRMFFNVKAWEPIRFRYYKHFANPGICCYSSPIKPSEETSWLFTNYPPSNSTKIDIGSPQCFDGSMVFRTGYGMNPDSSWWDDSYLFLMKWVAIDSSAIDELPSVEYSDPITLPDSGKYRIILSQAKPNVNGTLTYTDTTSHILFSDIQSHMGDTVIVGPYSAGSILQVNFNGTPPATTPYGYNVWNMGFENWIDYDFTDVKVRIEYDVQPPDHLELWSTDETVYYGDTVDVDVVPCGIDSLFSPLGPDGDYEFSIELLDSTSKYGQLIYNGQGSNLVEHIPSVDRRGVGAQFAANGIEPDSTVDLTFHLKAISMGNVIPCSVTRLPAQTVQPISKEIKLTIKSNNNKKGILPQLKSFAKTYRQSEVPSRYSTQNKNISIKDKKYTKPDKKQSKIKFAMKKVYNKRKIGHAITKVNNSRSKYSMNVTQKSLPQGNIMKLTQTGQGGGGDGYVAMENDWGMGINPPQDILLGQTIYFQAVVDPTHEKRLFIIPLEKASDRLNPVLPDVKFSVERRKGDKLGVYYDEKIDEDGNDLKPDMIRFIGRYWKEGDANKYSVKLTAKATTLNRIGGMLVEVKKPVRLGDTYNDSKDVFGQPLSIDEKCIEYGGKYGIPPQIIKGQIENESAFKPAYRWEPFYDEWLQSEDFFEDGFSYTIIKDPFSEGSPSIPTDHENAQPNYPTYKGPDDCKTIWDYFYDNSRTLNPYAATNTYNIRSSKDGRPLWYGGAVDGWEKAFYNTLKIEMINSFFYPNDFVGKARSDANNWLKENYELDKTAQTRASASYGFLQMTYATATGDMGYPKDLGGTGNNLPENINLTNNNFYLSMPYLSKQLEQEIKHEDAQANLDGNWILGFEETLRIALNMYNGKTEIDKNKKSNRYNWPYGKPVIQSSLNYKPLVELLP